MSATREEVEKLHEEICSRSQQESIEWNWDDLLGVWTRLHYRARVGGTLHEVCDDIAGPLKKTRHKWSKAQKAQLLEYVASAMRIASESKACTMSPGHSISFMNQVVALCRHVNAQIIDLKRQDPEGDISELRVTANAKLFRADFGFREAAKALEHSALGYDVPSIDFRLPNANGSVAMRIKILESLPERSELMESLLDLFKRFRSSPAQSQTPQATPLTPFRTPVEAIALKQPMIRSPGGRYYYKPVPIGKYPWIAKWQREAEPYTGVKVYPLDEASQGESLTEIHAEAAQWSEISFFHNF